MRKSSFFDILLEQHEKKRTGTHIDGKRRREITF
jgi:hypothetical protein